MSREVKEMLLAYDREKKKMVLVHELMLLFGYLLNRELAEAIADVALEVLGAAAKE